MLPVVIMFVNLLASQMDHIKSHRAVSSSLNDLSSKLDNILISFQLPEMYLTPFSLTFSTRFL
jgi:hypothetical protein